MRDVSYTDKQLLCLVKTGDEAAFNVLFERYRSKLYYYLLRHVKSKEIAEEIVIDIFMKLWKGRGLADQIQDVSAFFHKVGYYKALDFLRTTARREDLKQVYIDRAKMEQVKLPDELLIDEEAKLLLLRAINQLPPQRKLIYMLSRNEELSHEQIAEILNLSRSTVNNTIVSASRSISEYLKKHAVGKVALSVLLICFFLESCPTFIDR
ncbi:MAG: RNA polymerase sigma factor [Ginsengibacter sp.]